MAHFGKDLDDFNSSRYIHIRSAEQTENFTVYVITVTVGPYSWSVKHRYSEFYDLHEKLCATCKLDKSLLPPKKLFGNQTETFVKRRQRELEIYLQTVLYYLAQHVPSSLAYFLDFDKYEIHGVTQAMAEDLYSRGEGLLQTREKYLVTSLQLYSLTERLKLPEPTCDSGDVKKDLGHILDFITRAKFLKITAGPSLVGTSNIVLNKLVFDLTLFKSLQMLEICGCNFRLIKGLETVKQTLTQLEVHESSSSLKEMLLQEFPHWKAEDGSLLVGSWDNVTTLDLSNNSISELHECIQLMPNVENLNLSHNELEVVQNLQWLSQLTFLDLSHNKIRHLDSLHTKLGNVKVLSLAHNQLEHLRAFAKLYSLHTLNVTHNNIVSIEEVLHVSQLPCMEKFLLIGNMVTNSLDYRTKTLEMFGDRVREVKLDGQASSEKELSTVAVLQALRKAKNTKALRRISQNRNASASNLTEGYNPSPCGSLGDQAADRISPHSVPTSSSVPTSIPWPGEEAHSSHRSCTPVSQDSASSYNSTGFGESAVKPDPSPSSPLPFAGRSVEVAVSTSSKVPIGAAQALLNMIPEAHPFDLSCPIVGVAKPSPPTALTRNLPTKEFEAENLSGSNTEDTLLDSVHSDQDSSNVSTTHLPQKRNSNWTCNASDLPKLSNQSFVAWLKKQLSTNEETDSPISTPPTSRSPPACKADIVEIMWCFVQSLCKPDSLLPCCAILTSTTVFIEKLVPAESTFPGVPLLEPLHILPLKNIQQVVMGPCHSFLRLEEAFVGAAGTFTLYFLEPQGNQRLSQKVFSLCQALNTACDLDFVDLNGGDSELFKRIVSHEETLGGLASDRLVLMIPVRLPNDDMLHFLLLSENRVYCIDLKCALWPPPCFRSQPDGSLQFNIVHEFSVADKLVDVKIHPNEEWDQDNFVDDSSCKKSNGLIGVDFVVYQLSLTIETKNANPMRSPNLLKEQCVTFKYLFPSSAFRDQFLDRLSNLRAEQANRMLANVREEPEGGNEQMTDCRYIKCNQNDSNSFAPRKMSVSSDPPIISDEVTSSRPIPFIQSDMAQDQSVAESFRSLHSSSSESFQSIIESEGMDQATGDYRTSSLQGDLSTSPMSNFSRASISPPASQIAESKAVPTDKCSEACDRSENAEKYPQAVRQKFYTNATSKADSLPSSFEWKGYYFTAYPSLAEEHSRYSDINSQEVVSKPHASPPRASNQALTQTLLQLSLKAESNKMSAPASVNDSQNETELDRYLKKCVSSFDLMCPLSTKMKPICLMNGSELRKFFHSAIAQNTHLDVTEGLAEELHHVLWAVVVPYTNPKQEITTLIMLSTYAIYLVSDTGVKVSQTSRPSWMTHSRNQSDSAISWKTDKESPSKRKVVQPYLALKYKDLHQIDIGLFDQCVRLTGDNENTVFTIATRDSQVTETLVEKLKQVLSLSVSSPMLERSHQELEQDFYRDITKRTKSTVEGLVYTHPSQVKFVYPGDEAITDVLYLIRERLSSEYGSKVADKTKSLWLYIQCYLLPSDDPSTPSSITALPRTILLTSTHFTVAEEDVVTYPLPDFVRGLPENPCHEVLGCRSIDSLKRVHLHHSNPHWLSLTFVEEQPELVVDVNMQHFAHATAGRERQKVAPEITMKFFIQSLMEKEKLVQILSKLWKEQVSQVGRILDVQKI